MYRAPAVTPPGRPANPTKQQEFHGTVDSSLADMYMHNAREWGIPAPNYQMTTQRLPFTVGDLGPYYQWLPGDNHMDSPVEDAYRRMSNALSHYQTDFEEAFVANRPQVPRKSAQPVYTGFTNEMTMRGADGRAYTTDRMNWQWMPTDPSDSDYSDAMGLMAKYAPADPTLFTASADFMTAPGVDWRYSGH
jgi:hypothetical protein